MSEFKVYSGEHIAQCEQFAADVINHPLDNDPIDIARAHEMRRWINQVRWYRARLKEIAESESGELPPSEEVWQLKWWAAESLEFADG